jgi:hypothetical protein
MHNAEEQRLLRFSERQRVLLEKSKAAEQRLSINRVRGDELSRLEALWEEEKGGLNPKGERKRPTRRDYGEMCEKAKLVADEYVTSRSASSSSSSSSS